MIIKSLRTSELYIVAFVLAVWGIDRLGIDVGQLLAVLLGVQQTAADVARELQGIEEPRGTAGYWLAAAWLAARTALKARGIAISERPGDPRTAAAQPARRDPYRAWYEAPAGDRGRGIPDKPGPTPPPPQRHPAPGHQPLRDDISGSPPPADD